MLEEHGEGARRVEMTLFRVDGLVRCIEVGAGRPTRDAAFLTRLLAERLGALADPLDPGFGYDLVRLSVVEAISLDAVQAGFSGASENEAVERLVDRLGARLGAGQVERIVPQDRHLPEEAVRMVPSARPKSEAEPPWPLPPLSGEPLSRPVRLFDRPERIEVTAMVPEGPPLVFRWRRVLHEIVAAEGPERLSPPWWHSVQMPTTRDYYRVEDSRGARFWLYRDGLYGRETSAPCWYVHGLFA
jgi:protein ImuB